MLMGIAPYAAVGSLFGYHLKLLYFLPALILGVFIVEKSAKLHQEQSTTNS